MKKNKISKILNENSNSSIINPIIKKEKESEILEKKLKDAEIETTVFVENIINKLGLDEE